jgi:hypothetical protein
MHNYWKIYSRKPSWVENPDDFAEICLRKGVIAVGWSHTGDLNKFSSRDEIVNKLAKDYHWRISRHKKELSAYVSSLWHFKLDVQEGDIVLCPSKGSKSVYVGKIISDLYYDSSKMEKKCDFGHRRKVNWMRTLTHKDVLSIWPNGLFGGRQTVTRIRTNISNLRKLLGHRNSPRIISAKHVPFRPDKEWGREAERRALAFLRDKGMRPVDVSNQYKGWDIECGQALFEVKGRKSLNTTVRLTENEWNSAIKFGNRYTLLIFTAPSKRKLRKSFPKQIANPARSEEWKKEATYEYFLKE